MNYALNITLQCIKPCDMFWGGKNTIWLNHMLMGFKPCMGMDTIVIAMKLNYGKLGLVFDNGHQLVPLIYLSFHGSPKLRVWLTMDLSFHFGLRTILVSALHCEGSNSLGNKGKLHLDLMSAIHFCFVAPSLPYFSSSLCWCVCR